MSAADSIPGASPAESSGVDPFCRWCGSAAGECDQSSCRRELDAERFCTTCGRRLRVLITPAGHRSSCRNHGPLPD